MLKPTSALSPSNVVTAAPAVEEKVQATSAIDSPAEGASAEKPTEEAGAEGPGGGAAKGAEAPEKSMGQKIKDGLKKAAIIFVAVCMFGPLGGIIALLLTDKDKEKDGQSGSKSEDKDAEKGIFAEALDLCKDMAKEMGKGIKSSANNLINSLSGNKVVSPTQELSDAKNKSAEVKVELGKAKDESLIANKKVEEAKAKIWPAKNAVDVAFGRNENAVNNFKVAEEGVRTAKEKDVEANGKLTAATKEAEYAKAFAIKTTSGENLKSATQLQERAAKARSGTAAELETTQKLATDDNKNLATAQRKASTAEAKVGTAQEKFAAAETKVGVAEGKVAEYTAKSQATQKALASSAEPTAQTKTAEQSATPSAINRSTRDAALQAMKGSQNTVVQGQSGAQVPPARSAEMAAAAPTQGASK